MFSDSREVDAGLGPKAGRELPRIPLQIRILLDHAGCRRVELRDEWSGSSVASVGMGYPGLLDMPRPSSTESSVGRWRRIGRGASVLQADTHLGRIRRRERPELLEMKTNNGRRAWCKRQPRKAFRHQPPSLSTIQARWCSRLEVPRYEIRLVLRLQASPRIAHVRGEGVKGLACLDWERTPRHLRPAENNLPTAVGD